MPDARVLRIVVDAEHVDLAADLLWRHHPLAVSEETDDAGRVVLTAAFADAGQTSAVAELARPQFAVEQLTPEGDHWVDTWRAGAEPHAVGPFRIRLPEHQSATGGIDIEIEPGATFGYGHETTLLALEGLARLDLEGCSVADVGCGSGVLAVAAARSGARPVHAVDTDAAAVAATSDSVRRNRVAVDVREGSVDALPGADYDVVLANLTAQTLCRTASELAGLVGTGGRLVVSGLLTVQQREVEAAFVDLAVLDTLTSGEWTALVLG